MIDKIIKILFLMVLSHSFVYAEEVKLTKEGETYSVPITINDAIKLNFIIDTGAAHVTVPSDVLKTLLRTGTIQKSDMLGVANYKFANGKTEENKVFNIRKMKIGNKYIYNIKASAATHENAPLLLGQSALKKLEPWRLNTNKNIITIEGDVSKIPPKRSNITYRNRIDEYNLGQKYANVLNYEKAIYWYTKSANNKYPDTKRDLFGRFINPSKKLKMDEGYAPAQYRLGTYLASSLTPVKLYDENKSKYWIAKACKTIPKDAKKGNPEAQLIYASLYDDGNMGERNITKAIYWYKQAAEQDNLEAMDMLGYIYETDFKEKNIQKSIIWYKKASRHGSVSVQRNLARIYINKEQYNKAMYWYQKSAQLGDKFGQLLLGEGFEQGKGIKKSYKKAIYWYKKSAEQGAQEAYYNLGRMYCRGKGIEKSLKTCAYWLNKVHAPNRVGGKLPLQIETDTLWKEFELWKYE